jgi:ubiquinone/menaquinone biosynthesis C-methylase UbiE
LSALLACGNANASSFSVMEQLMSDSPPTPHQIRIVDQFTRQAIPFSQAAAIANEQAMDLLIKLTSATHTDTVLDVACGPGLVALAFAPHVAHVTGIDLTPAMIQRARTLQQERDIANVTWHIGDVTRLPYDDASFSMALTRYSVHHFPDPHAVLTEMRRVCRPGGTLAVVDLFTAGPPEQAEAYNQMERLRDPSHVRALSLEELRALMETMGVSDLRSDFYKVESELEQWLGRAFPVTPADADRVRHLVRQDVGHDRLGIGAHRRGEQLHLALPAVALVGQRR